MEEQYSDQLKELRIKKLLTGLAKSEAKQKGTIYASAAAKGGAGSSSSRSFEKEYTPVAAPAAPRHSAKGGCAEKQEGESTAADAGPAPSNRVLLELLQVMFEEHITALAAQASEVQQQIGGLAKLLSGATQVDDVDAPIFLEFVAAELTAARGELEISYLTADALRRNMNFLSMASGAHRHPGESLI
jgi:hypothetical protein